MGSVLIKRTFSLFLVISFVISCAPTQLLIHTAKRVDKASEKKPKTTGRYKVGNPYKIKGIWYYPKIDYNYDQTGIASWYGPGFHGKITANGETYDQNALTAAHRTLPMPSIVQVTNLENGRSIKVTVNDRGPYAFGRIIDMSRRGAQLLGFHQKGTARVRVKILADESRYLAHKLVNGTKLARIGSPIKTDINVAKPEVASENLAPPFGKRSISVEKKYKPRVIGNKTLDITTNPSPGSNAEVFKKEILPTNMYVQAGAFTRYGYANRAAARLEELGNVKITSARIQGKEFFRVRAGPINLLKDADAILERKIMSGFQNARIIVD